MQIPDPQLWYPNGYGAQPLYDYVVELRAGFAGDDAMRQSLLDFCAERLAKQKWPRRIDFIVTLPRSPAGKVLRSALREEYWAGRSRQI